MSEWQSIETAPRDGKNILVALHFKNGKYWGLDIIWWNERWNEWESAGYDWRYADDDDERITHWMPLPEPPTLKEGER